MTGKLVTIAIGGNSLITDPKKPDIPHQWDAVRETCEHIAAMLAEGWNVIVTWQRPASRLYPAPF